MNLKNKSNIILSVIAAILVIIAIIYLLTIDNNNKKKSDTYIESDVKLIQSYDDVATLSGDGALRAKISELIQQGVNDCYCLNNRYFVILSTGESQEGLVYETVTDYNTGKLKLLYRFANDNNPDVSLKIRYRILEFNGPVEVEKYEGNRQGQVKQGIMKMIIYGGDDNLKVYYPDYRYGEMSESGYANGIYTAVYRDNEIEEIKKLDTITIECTVLDQLLDKTYNVDLGNLNIVNINLDDINIDYGTKCTIELSYKTRYNGKVIKKAVDI